jgi:hypothetical protein
MLIPKKKAADTVITVGPYRMTVRREVFQKWEAELMREAGFTDTAIKAEILRRLGYAHD